MLFEFVPFLLVLSIANLYLVLVGSRPYHSDDRPVNPSDFISLKINTEPIPVESWESIKSTTHAQISLANSSIRRRAQIEPVAQAYPLSVQANTRSRIVIQPARHSAGYNNKLGLINCFMEDSFSFSVSHFNIESRALLGTAWLWNITDFLS